MREGDDAVDGSKIAVVLHQHRALPAAKWAPRTGDALSSLAGAQESFTIVLGQFASGGQQGVRETREGAREAAGSAGVQRGFL